MLFRSPVDTPVQQHTAWTFGELPELMEIRKAGQTLIGFPALIDKGTAVEIEVFAFGSLCVMVEGRCALSSYATGQSPNNAGVCSPASAVRWQERDGGVSARLNGVLIDHYGPDEPRGYPTLCKGRFEVDGRRAHVLEEPTSLNTLALLPQLVQMGVRAFKIEGRQRSAAYVGEVTRAWRAALDQACAAVAEGRPAAVNPLLSSFDFTGICGRYIDANGYSVRVGDTDLATVYRLSVVNQDNDILLMALPTRPGAGPEKIGRAHV